ncbi:DUF6356 family protein [Methylobacterium nonmethylotrophicum]|uniref:Capsule biosynthesis protein n=1 Tax=Methylobacterium nonmethylotrophicum TaxID=1141884 RepID=A0A4Z0NLE8_9HYPH|nr:DUF6356 family protein [Methylobacterium nonmethylotrophicum]TGD97246.1 hypothetical protein EU555_21045 [Methylobacterium nonmethylotrophicum]
MSKLSFSEHPASVGETYFEHMGVATGFGLRMIAGGLACLVHGILPFAFTSTGSRTINRLHDRMVANRTRAAQHRTDAASAVSA